MKRAKLIGITVADRIGIGDAVQFASLPENYFRETGEKLVDCSKHWMFDHNPYVLRDVDRREIARVQELWNYGPKQYEWPIATAGFYRSNSEIWARLFGVMRPKLARPRLYRYETYPFEDREMILFHPCGKSHGQLPDAIIEHVIKKYSPTGCLYQVGSERDPSFGIPRLPTPTLWDLAREISQARLFIGADSGPSWIAACYPDVVVKKVRTREVHGERPYHDWLPLERANVHAHWDDRAFQIYNKTEDDVGFMQSYLKL